MTTEQTNPTSVSRARLEGKVAVVTGGAMGIGRAIAAAFIDNGASVLLVDSQSDAVDEAATALGDKAIGFSADITDAQTLEPLASLVKDRFGCLDILVNNAGSRIIKPFLEYTEADFRRMLDVNIVGHFLTCKALIPLMIETGGRRIINTVSIASWQGRPNRIGYCAGKGGQYAFTRALAADMAIHGIRVNGIAPGMIASPLNKQFTEDSSLAETWNSENLVGRWGTPEDVASAAVFLASDEADFINGEFITIDGGAVAALVRRGELD